MSVEKPSKAKAVNSSEAGEIVPYVPPLPFGEAHLAEENSYTDLVIKSTLSDADPVAQSRKVMEAFNVNVKTSVIVDAGARHGDRLEPGMFLIAHMNKIPELAVGDGSRLTLRITGAYTDTGYVGKGKYHQSDPLIGDYGHYIINVPRGKLARVWSGNTPKLLGEGPHVIHDPMFRAEEHNMFVDVASPYIEHGVVHIVRVPVGHYARVTVNTKAHLLVYRPEPYAFTTPLFLFPENGFVPQSDPYISHGPLHLIRVPAGRVAKAWKGSKAILLEYREEPYFFDDPLFRMEPHSSSDIFADARLKHIRHGCIDRIRPGVNGDLELAVLQTDGEIKFVDRFQTLDDTNHAVLGFLNMGLQTMIFPSKATRDERRRENPKASPEEISYEPMTTRDSLKVGLKLLVAYQVNDAPKVLRRLRIADIESHVESLAVSDMARAVQNSTSQNFLNSSPSRGAVEDASKRSIADIVRDELAHHLEECGLQLVRFNVEEAKVLDAELAKEMAKQALVAATASAQQATIDQKTAVAKSNAELEAMARRVQQDQENQIKISAAQADLDAARIRAQALLIEAEAKQKAAQMEGEQFRKYPELLQLQIAQLQMASLRDCKVTIVSSEIAQTPFGLSAVGVGGLFGATGVKPRTTE